MSPDPSSATQKQVEDLLGSKPYRVVRLIGQGGMGEVWQVKNTALDSEMALKVMHSRHMRSRFHRERFLLEARATASISHPNVVKVVDYWEAPGCRPCFVMQLLSGRTLAKELRARNCLSTREVVDFGYQAASALQAVHDAGLVHRDLKPDNLFLHGPADGKRLLKLLDFGLARVMSPDFETGPVVPSMATQTGSMVGSPRFMSPEGLRGERVDHRADIYSLGVVLYMALVGRHYLFDWATRPVFAPPSQLGVEQCSVELDAAILKAVEARPDDRYQNARAFLAALQLLRPAEASAKFSLPRGILRHTKREEDR